MPAQIGTDRKSLLAIDPATYGRAVTVGPRLLAGAGLDALARDPMATIVHKEIADGFQVLPGDLITLTVFPDDPGRTRNVRLRAATTAFTVTTVSQQRLSEQRGLTALNLRALGRVETVAAGLVAAVGVAVLGAFLVPERRRESAVLRAVGASTRQLITGPAVESGIAVLTSLAVGLPSGIAIGMLSIRVLGLFFTLPPPLVVVPQAQLAALAVLVAAASGVAIGATLVRVAGQANASVLREP